MLPGAPTSTINQELTLSSSAKSILLGRYPQLTDAVIRDEINAITREVAKLQLQAITTRVTVDPDSIMDSSAHNDFLMRVGIDLSVLYNRIYALRTIIEKAQLLSVAGLNDLKARVSILENLAAQLVAVHSNSSLIGALILTRKLSEAVTSDTAILPDGAYTLNYDEVSYNDQYSVASVNITFLTNVYTRECLGVNPELDYASGSYSCFKRGMANGVWYENVYVSVPPPDGIVYTITINFRGTRDLNALYYSLIDRANNQVQRVEVQGATGVWATARCGGIVLDSTFGWSARKTDPVSLEFDLTAAKAIRLTIRNISYDLEELAETTRSYLLPKTAGDVLKLLPRTTKTQYSRYKTGAYYIVPCRRTIISPICTITSHPAGEGFEPSRLYDGTDFYANHLAVFANTVVNQTAGQTIKTDLIYNYDNMAPLIIENIDLGLPGVIYYGDNLPQPKIETIAVLNDINDQLQPDCVIPTTAPFINMEKWGSTSGWLYIDEAGNPTSTATYAINYTLTPLLSTDIRHTAGTIDWVVESQYGDQLDTDSELKVAFTYISVDRKTLYYRFVGVDKTTNIPVVETDMLSELPTATTSATWGTTLHIKTSNAIGVLTIYYNTVES